MKNRVFEILKFLIGWPLSILALIFIIKLIVPQAAKFISHLNQISLPLLSLAIICFLIYYFMRGYIWKRLIKQSNHEISYKDANFIWAASELKRYIPGNIWSFVGRAVLFSERGISKKDIARYSIIEIELIILGSITISLLSLPFIVQRFTLPQYLNTILPLTLTIIFLIYIFNQKLKLKHFILPDFSPAEILFLIFLNIITFLFFGLGYYLVFASFTSINPNLVWQLTGFSVLAFIAGYLSLLTPSGFGVREGALVFGLTKIMSVSSAGFLALFSRFILIVAELIFVGISYIWYKIKNKYLSKVETWIGKNTHLVILFLLFLIYILYFTFVSFLRYDNFYAGRFDLGNMAQTVWNTTQGNFFMMTDANGTDIVSRLSVHADFILILLAPFYAIWSNPKVLLLIQTIILSAGCFFVYLIVEKLLKSKNLALTFAFAYLINPAVQRTNLYDFHAVTLATTFLLGAYYYFMNKKYKLFLLFAFFAGICKEQIWATIGLFGIFLFFQHKKRIFGVLLFTFCFLISYFLIAKAIPQALGTQHFALAYFSDFGDSPSEIIKNIIFSPGQTITTIIQQDRIDYLKQLLSPLGYFSLFSPLILLFTIPELAISLLSSNPQLHQIYYQYSATITPFLFIAAIYGSLYIKKIAMKQFNNLTINIMIILYLLGASLYAAYSFGPLPGAKDANLDMITKPFADKEFVENYISKINKNQSIAASNNIGSHFSNREKIYVLPIGVDKADLIIFLLTDSEYPQSLAAQKKLAEKLKTDPSYKAEIVKDKFLVYKRIYNP